MRVCCCRNALNVFSFGVADKMAVVLPFSVCRMCFREPNEAEKERKRHKTFIISLVWLMKMICTNEHIEYILVLGLRVIERLTKR